MCLNNFCGSNKSWYLFNICLCFIFIALGCSNEADKAKSDVKTYQLVIDSLLQNVVVPIKSTIDTRIIENQSMGKDTFELARQRVPITKIQFLISNEYFALEEALKKYDTKNLSTEQLILQLNSSKSKVDSLMTYQLLSITSNE